MALALALPDPLRGVHGMRVRENGGERLAFGQDAKEGGMYRFGSMWKRFEDGRYHCKGQNWFEEPDPEPNKGRDPGSPEPVSRTLTALVFTKQMCHPGVNQRLFAERKCYVALLG